MSTEKVSDPPLVGSVEVVRVIEPASNCAIVLAFWLPAPRSIVT
jgi:hypothetical protein